MSMSADPEIAAPSAAAASAKDDGGQFWFTAVGKHGTYMSLLVLVIGIVVSILTQHFAPQYINLDSWQSGCPNDYEDACKATSAVLRISFALTALYALQIVGTSCYTKFFDTFWLLKFSCFVVVVIGFFFAPVEVFDLRGYAWFARITGFLYLILQQIILLDIAYTWNERWLALSTEDGERGQRYLAGLLFFSVVLFTGSITVIGLLFWQFGKCQDSQIIISITLVFPLIATLVQVFLTDEGSLLTSAIMMSYSVYVCYSAVTLNPDLSCNPALDTGYQDVSTGIGLGILVVSLTWATYNSAKRIPSVTDSSGQTIDLMNIATGGNAHHGASSSSGGAEVGVEQVQLAEGGAYQTPAMKALFVQISVVFLLISGYYAMVLTNWVTAQENDSIQDPRTGRAAMWIQAAGQWIAISIYLWSLIAPKILKNRDFS